MKKLWALYWKELRENTVWGLLCAAGFSIGLAYGWGQVNSPNNDYYSFAGLLHDSVKVVTLFGSIVVGLILGFVQTMHERARDRWAFFYHKPVWPGQLLAGKLLAGLTWYSVATLVPFLYLGWKVAQPQAFLGYFFPEMLYFGLLHIAGGAVCYLLAMLIAVRETRWFPGKVICLLVAYQVYTLVSRGDEYWHRLVYLGFYAGLIVIVLATIYRRTDASHRFSRGAQVAFFFLLVIGAIQGVSGVIQLQEIFVGEQRYYPGKGYSVLQDGRVVKETPKNGYMPTLTTIDGQDAGVPRKELRDNKTFAFRAALNPWEPGQSDNTSFESIHELVYAIGDDEETLWFVSRRKPMLLGYNLATKVLNYVGNQEGIHSFTSGSLPSPMAGQFIGGSDESLVFTDVIYSLDLENKTIDQLWRANQPPKELGCSIAPERWQKREESNKALASFFVIKIDDRLQLLDTKTRKLLWEVDWKLPKNYRLDNPYYLGRDQEKLYFFLAPQENFFGKEIHLQHYYLDTFEVKTGSFQRQALPGLADPWKERPFEWESLLYTMVFGTVHQVGESLLSPFTANPDDKFIWNWSANGKKRVWQDLLLEMAVGLVVAGAAALIYRRREMWSARRWWMLAGVFVFGFPGLVAMALYHQWPALQSCLSCRKNRRVDQDHCHHCGAEWADAPKDGTEIFSPTPKNP